MKTILLILCFLLVTASVIFADGDIVYSADYYLPPGSRGESGFHLYRINPDGTGKRQITFSDADDDHPQWSPDGKSILFERTVPSKDDDSSRTMLCLISVQGGHVTKLLDMGSALDPDWSDEHWSPDGHTIAICHEPSKGESPYNRFASIYLLDVQTKKQQRLAGFFVFDWSPDGKHASISNKQECGIYDLNSGKIVKLSDDLDCPIWLGSQALATFKLPSEKDDGNQSELFLLDLNGQEQKRFSLENLDNLIATPYHEHIIDSHYAGNSTTGVDHLYFDVNLETEKCRYFTIGQFLAWSPDGKQFCTAPGRDLTPYEKRWYPPPYLTPRSIAAKHRMVWTAPLYIRATAGGPMHQLTPRLSWVTGADWRKNASNK